SAEPMNPLAPVTATKRGRAAGTSVESTRPSSPRGALRARGPWLPRRGEGGYGMRPRIGGRLEMAHVVTERCVNCRYTYCAVECPVTCFWEIKNPHMLVIDPDTCIDCEACVPACPVNAIWPDHELPEAYASW